MCDVNWTYNDIVLDAKGTLYYTVYDPNVIFCVMQVWQSI